jgi:UDP-glucose 4-epimerase
LSEGNGAPGGRRGSVLLTGAGGSLGRAVVERLEGAGFTVRRASRVPDGQNGRQAAFLLPDFAAPVEEFRTLLAGADHVVHMAGRTNADRAASETDYMNANATLTDKLAQAAADVVPGRFVFASSIRAVAGREFRGVIDEKTEPAPSCAYGRSKRAGELAAAARFGGDAASRLSVVRPAPVYGAGMKGNLATLMRLADTPFPLPLGSMLNRRSLLSADGLADAIVHLVGGAGASASAYVVSDLHAVSIADMIWALRRGFRRPRRLFPFPVALGEAAAALFGRAEAWQGIFAEQICDPSALAATGWAPRKDTLAGLSALAAQQDGPT